MRLTWIVWATVSVASPPPPSGAPWEALIRLSEARAKAELRRSVLEPESGVAFLGFRSTV